MPDKLKWAFSLYCESLVEFENPDVFPSLSGTSLPIDDLADEDVVLSSLMSGIPMAVQSLLFEFVDPIALRETFRPGEQEGININIINRNQAQSLVIT